MNRHPGKPRRASPEAALQISVKQYLNLCLTVDGPTGVFWTASLTGTYLTPAARSMAKAMGVRPGAPDLCFVFPDGISRWIELKSEVGSLSLEQREFRDLCKASGRDIWACCRTVDQVAEILRRWGAPLRDHPFNAPAAALQLPWGGSGVTSHIVMKPSPSGDPRLMWTVEAETELRRMWSEGLTGSEIAARLGSGITRAAVIGKAHRLKLSSRDPGAAAKAHNDLRWDAFYAERGLERPVKPKRAELVKPAKPRPNTNFAAVNAARRALDTKGPDLAAVIALHAVPPTARPWVTRKFGECAFPVAGLGAETVSCCGPTGGETYCAAHRAVMYAKPATPAQRAHMAKMRAMKRRAA